VMENSEILGSALARRTLKSTSAELEPPNQELLDDFAATYKKEILFEKEETELDDVFAAWNEDRVVGMVAIVGDHGSGKSQILRKVFSKWKKEHIVCNIMLQQRCTSPSDLVALLAEQLGIEAKSSKTMIEVLRELPSRVICIDEMQRSMLRDVGGYDAIQTLLAIMQGTAHQHFWVGTFHLHSWIFLHSASTPVNLSIFRKTIHIKSLGVNQVEDWILERCKVANIELDFSEISTISNEESLRRARLLFWRLLTDLSNGNPGVIEQFWISSMRKGSSEREVKIVLFTIPDEKILDSLTDTEAFILAYLLIHDDLSLPMLQRSLNIHLPLVQVACRHLLGLGLIVKKQERYEIHDWWWPLIERFLVKKRMIYLE